MRHTFLFRHITVNNSFLSPTASGIGGKGIALFQFLKVCRNRNRKRQPEINWCKQLLFCFFQDNIAGRGCKSLLTTTCPRDIPFLLNLLNPPPLVYPPPLPSPPYHAHPQGTLANIQSDSWHSFRATTASFFFFRRAYELAYTFYM